MELEKCGKLADDIEASYGKGKNAITRFAAFELAIEIRRLEIESERNQILKDAFVVRDGVPSALEFIGMQLRDK